MPTTTYEAIHSLISRDDPEALRELGALSVAADEFVRRTAIEVIGKHPRGRELHESILTALGDHSEYVKRTACDVVAQWKSVEAHQFMLPLLKASEASTRECALRALAAIWSKTDFPQVFDIYQRDPDTSVRREAAWTLRRCADVDIWRALFDAFRKDELPRHRSWACELAEIFGDRETLPVLSTLAHDHDGHVRSAAERASRAITQRTRD